MSVEYVNNKIYGPAVFTAYFLCRVFCRSIYR